MNGNKNDIYNQLEDIIINILNKQGVLNNHHEVATVIRQLSDTSVLVSSNQFDDVEPEVVNCAMIDGGYRMGDRVLIEYLNGSAHHKFVIATMQKGYEKAEIDYSKLEDTPLRVFRRPGIAMQDPTDMVVDLGDEGPLPMVWKILYQENTAMEWWEEFDRDEMGRLKSIRTFWPPITVGLNIVIY